MTKKHISKAEGEKGHDFSEFIVACDPYEEHDKFPFYSEEPTVEALVGEFGGSNDGVIAVYRLVRVVRAKLGVEDLTL